MKPIKTHVGECATLVTIPTDRFKTNLISLVSPIALTKENDVNAKLLYAVLMSGTEKYPNKREISRRTDELWSLSLASDSSARSGISTFGLRESFLSPSYLSREDGKTLLQGSAELLSQILLHPVTENGLLSARFVEREKQKYCDIFRARRKDPKEYSRDRFGKIMLGDHPLANCNSLGDEKKVMAITPESLTEYYKNYIADFRPVIFASGDVTPEQLAEVFAPYFGTGFQTSPLSYTEPVRLERRETPIAVDEEMPVTQSVLRMGFCCGVLPCDRDYASALVYNGILGASPVSKLFTNVREKKSLCYSCWSHYDPYVGTVNVYCGLKDANRKVAEDEINTQFEAVKNGQFTDKELHSAKELYIDIYRGQEDSQSQALRHWSGNYFSDCDKTAEERLEEVSKVTRDDVIALANRVTPAVTYYLRGTRKGWKDDENEDK